MSKLLRYYVHIPALVSFVGQGETISYDPILQFQLLYKVLRKQVVYRCQAKEVKMCKTFQ